MSKYRVLFEDDFEGQKFNFAVYVTAESNATARLLASQEFPGLHIEEIKSVEEEKELDELLAQK